MSLISTTGSSTLQPRSVYLIIPAPAELAKVHLPDSLLAHRLPDLPFIDDWLLNDFIEFPESSVPSAVGTRSSRATDLTQDMLAVSNAF